MQRREDSRSPGGLHLKLVLIMLLLILSLMLVVSAFLIRGVKRFYLGEFYAQMQEVFSDAEFVSHLRAAAGDENGAVQMEEILRAYSGALGIDKGRRGFYLLRGDTGRLLAASDGSAELVMTPNIVTALGGSEGYAASRSADYMDVAVPIRGGENRYVICVRDNKQTVTALTRQIFTILAEALLIGLAISVLLSLLLSKTLVIPIQRLTRAAGNVAAGDFSGKLPSQSGDEIGVLTRTFNNMADRLQTTLLEMANERNKLSTVFLHMTDGIVAFSAEGQIIQYNPAAERLLGVELAAKDLDFNGIFGDIAALERVLALGSSEVITGERDQDGRSLDIFLAPFSGKGTQGGVLAVLHDVTEQRRSDEQRREFVANVSHELRTPITNVRSYAETLVDSAAELPPETVTQFLGVILSESDRMTKIVQDLLALSRFDAGENDLRSEPVDLAAVTHGIYEAMRLDTAKRGLALSISLPPASALVMGDQARLEQVIVNIASNAVRYTPAGGSVELSVQETEREVQVSVADTGIGIPKESIAHVFDRFYRVDKARSRAMGGTGLGLSISQEIVRRHGGDIRIASEPGVGTTVTDRKSVV